MSVNVTSFRQYTKRHEITIVGINFWIILIIFGGFVFENKTKGKALSAKIINAQTKITIIIKFNLIYFPFLFFQISFIIIIIIPQTTIYQLKSTYARITIWILMLLVVSAIYYISLYCNDLMITKWRLGKYIITIRSLIYESN